ncbi:MAG: glutathione S-transferase family protein [Pseudomonadota bacterium]
MNDLTFYTNPMSRGRIIRWLLEESGIDYDTVILSYDGEMTAPEYLAINPMGKVPAIRHAGKVVTECAAICAYIADAFPEARLAPPADDRADYYRWLFFAAGPLEQAVVNRSLGFEVTSEQGRMAGYGSYDRAVDVLEAMIAGRDYVTGEHFTAADVYVGSQVNWGLDFGTLPARDAFKVYSDRLKAREAYQRAVQIDDSLMAP